MATLVVGAVGAAVGWVIGGPAGAQWGWAIGTTIGGIAFAPKIPGIEGPRLDDLKAQKSNYGVPVPVVYGSMRIAGNVIWAADLVETSSTTGGGGKGTPSGGEQTTYSYSQSFAVGLCEGTIIGVRRIWANGKLIYNVSATADNATLVASNAVAARIRFHTGSETQVADSLIQAHEGAANTPAFRGLAYVVFEDMQLADYGNRAPNLEFEVVSAGSETQELQEITSANTFIPSMLYGTSSIAISSGYLYRVKTSYGPANIEIFDISSGAILPIKSFATRSDNGAYTKIQIKGNYLFMAGYITGTGAVLFAFDISDPVNPVEVGTTNTVYNQTLACINGDYAYLIGWHTLVGTYAIDVINITDPSNMYRSCIVKVTTSTGIYDLTVSGNYAYIATDDKLISCYNISDPTNVFFVSSVSLVYGYALYVNRVLVSGNYLFAVATSSTGIGVVDITNPASMSFVSFTSVSIGTSPGDTVIDGDYLFTISGYSGLVSVTDISNINNIHNVASYGVTTANNSGGMAVSNGYLYASYHYEAKIRKLLFRSSLSATAPLLSSIVSDICTRAGLLTSDINVAALTDTVDGYTVQRGTTRSWIEQLMKAYYFDAVESDGKVKFVKRGGASVVSIPEDDLAAREYGSAPPDTMVTTRQQEMELPVEVAVQYLDKDSSYVVGSQLSSRLTTNSENKVGINLALSLSGSKAKQISDVLMYDAWTSRTAFDVQTGWKYSYLEPTDIVTITKGGRTYTARINGEDTSGGIWHRQLTLEDSSVYTQSASAPSMPAQVDTVSDTPLTNLMLLDIPLLRDQDDGYGFYTAACGYGAGWRGAQAFKSNDSGATWSSFGSPLVSEATIGSTSTLLGNFTGGNIFDETNSVTVVTMSGTLSSDSEINILNGANVALIGNEVIQFRTAALIATGTYTLSGLLRGRKGTEWAMTTHAVGDRFVLLSASTTYLFYGPSAEYDVLRKYKGVSFGNYLVNAQQKDFINTAVALIPYSPVQLGGGRNAAGDLTLNWVRRTRLSGGWNNYSDVPIGETTEAYEVEIYDATYTTLKRTITGLTSATASYTAAQQITDFGAPQSTVYWKVYQISATVGRGYEARSST